VPAAPWIEAVLGLVTVAVAFALVRPRAGLAAAGVAAFAVALTPGLAFAVRRQVSEPLGALLLVASVLALAVALERGGTRWRLLCGVLLGATVLTRADLLGAPVLVALVVAAVAWRRAGRADGLRAGAVVLAGALALMGPWIVFASASAGRLVLVSSAGGSTAFAGTFLPGDGTIYGMRRVLAPEVRRAQPRYRNARYFQIPAAKVLDVVAARHPGLARDAALSAEARHNLRRYALGRPVAFAAMMARKTGRMWLDYYHAESAFTHARRLALRALHLVLLAAALAGIAVGLARRRDPLLAAVLLVALYSTLDNAVLVAEPRHNVTLLPALYVAGAVGWAAAMLKTVKPRAAAAQTGY
jgi:4-amino-4-deoxy-L-arabinose transferase-like glycosyltransferase